ncbi:uncharacterized protein C11orf16 homolog [Pleurodeles waltl]
MHLSAGSLVPDHRYCSVVTDHEHHSCSRLTAKHDPWYSCSCIAHPPWTAARPLHERCSWVSHSSCLPDITCKKTHTLERFLGSGLLALHTPILSRRDPDGFYYRATLKQEVEGENGMFLVEFYKQSTVGEKYQTFLQKTAIDDIIDYSDAIQHCIVPGDKVLAPWEDELIRYGPGTVTQGIETRDPLRVTEDEEITVSFWNGKKAKVPLGVAIWIPPTEWERIVRMLHFPLSSRHQEFKEHVPRTTTYVQKDRFVSVPIHTCYLDGLYRQRWPCSVVSSHCSHPLTSCHAPMHLGCTCSSHSKCNDWWPLLPTTTIHIKNSSEKEPDTRSVQPQKDQERAETKPTISSFSSSSSASSVSSDDDSESENETCLTRSTMVDSAVNTDYSLWEKPSAKSENGKKTDWKYWKRSHPEPHHRKPGSSVCSNRFSDRRFDPDSKVFSGSDLSSAGPINQSSMFEAVLRSPSRRVTMKDVLFHNDFEKSSGPQGRPLIEQLGRNQIEQEKQKQTSIEYLRRKKHQHQDWESKREQEAEKKYSDTQETHRQKTQQHFQNEERKLKEQIAKRIQSLKVKQVAQQNASQRMQTLSEEEKQKEQRRLAHLKNVREKIDEREFQKCREEAEKELKTQESRRKRVDDHYKQMADKVFEAETRSGGYQGKRILEHI